MERLTKKEKLKLSHGEELILCKHKESDCNDSCMSIRPCKWYKKVQERLWEYENLEEQGLLLRLPCKVGDVVAIVLIIPSTEKRCIEQAEVKEINIGKYNTREDIQLKVEPIARRGTVYKYYVSEWGENIFPTLSEAEKALADMGV